MREAKLVEFPYLGPVRIAFRNNTSRISARWKDGIVSVSAPSGMEFNEILRTIERFTPRLMSLRKDVTYREGVMDFDGITFEIRRQSVLSRKGAWLDKDAAGIYRGGSVARHGQH